MHNCRNKIQALPKRLPRSGLAVLETCVSLGDCERVLFERLRKVKFIGEVELSSADLQKLTNLIATELAPNPKRGLRLLKQKAPASIARISCVARYHGIQGRRLLDAGASGYRT